MSINPAGAQMFSLVVRSHTMWSVLGIYTSIEAAMARAYANASAYYSAPTVIGWDEYEDGGSGSAQWLGAAYDRDDSLTRCYIIEPLVVDPPVTGRESMYADWYEPAEVRSPEQRDRDRAALFGSRG